MPEQTTNADQPMTEQAYIHFTCIASGCDHEWTERWGPSGSLTEIQYRCDATRCPKCGFISPLRDVSLDSERQGDDRCLNQ